MMNDTRSMSDWKELCRQVLSADDMGRIEGACPDCNWDALFALIQRKGTQAVPEVVELVGILHPNKDIS
jgi:hypothetical protein